MFISWMLHRCCKLVGRPASIRSQYTSLAGGPLPCPGKSSAPVSTAPENITPRLQRGSHAGPTSETLAQHGTRVGPFEAGMAIYQAYRHPDKWYYSHGRPNEIFDDDGKTQLGYWQACRLHEIPKYFRTPIISKIIHFLVTHNNIK